MMSTLRIRFGRFVCLVGSKPRVNNLSDGCMSPTHEPDQMSPAHLRRPFCCRIYLVAAFDWELGLSGRSRGRGGAIWEGAALGSLSCA